MSAKVENIRYIEVAQERARHPVSVELDRYPMVVDALDGAWVQAWIYVSDEDAGRPLTDEAAR